MAKGKGGDASAGKQKGIKRDLGSNKIRKGAPPKGDLKSSYNNMNRQLTALDAATRMATNIVGGKVGQVAAKANDMARTGMKSLGERARKVGMAPHDYDRSAAKANGSILKFVNDLKQKTEAREIRGPAAPKKPIGKGGNRSDAAKKGWITRKKNSGKS